MPLLDDDDKPKTPDWRLAPAQIDALSVDELTARIAQLEAEIERLRAAITQKSSHRGDAEKLFKM